MNLQFHLENKSWLRSLCVIINAITEWNVSNETTLLWVYVYIKILFTKTIHDCIKILHNTIETLLKI